LAETPAGQEHFMAIEAEPSKAPSALLRRIVRVRAVVIITVIVFAVLAVTETLAPLQALLGAAVIALAAFLGSGSDGMSIVSAGRQQGAAQNAADRVIAAAIAGFPDAVIVVDRQETVIAFNPRVSTISNDIALGRPVSFALRIPDLIDALRRAVATGESQRVEFFERVPADRWSEAFVTPIVLPSENTRQRELFVVTLHDLTPIRRVEEMRADFVANASHELRTPLASLAGFIDTLQGSAKDDVNARARFLDIMKAQATRMARLIDDLLSLSRIELRAHLQPTAQVDLVAIVRHVADGLQVLARDRGVEIALDMPAAALNIRGDRDELIRAFENLIENALKYGAAGKRVEVTGREEATATGKEAVVSVRDYGPGIAPEHLPRLTERFYRVDIADSRSQGGTGLGLALAKHVFNRHRGRMIIESVPGQGATFTARLPLIG
jgi:two-component system phosphate regulon sensor histidine kinase PhoR